MNPVHILRDDVGSQQLKTAHALPEQASAISGLAPYPAVREESRTHLFPQRPKRERRQTERRGERRRRAEMDVLLDTRSDHERRVRCRRASDVQNIALSGVDLYI